MSLSLDRGIAFAVAILLLNFIAWRFLRLRNGRPRFIIRLALFASLSTGLWLMGANPLDPAPWRDNAPRHVLYQILELLWWLQAAELCSSVLGVVLLPPTLRRERLFQDVLRAITFMVAAVLAVAHVLAVPVGGLLATSGALAIILGLAVQSTLSDVFSGIVLNATQPFVVGDLVTIGKIQGEVVDSDWRATTLLNGQGNYVVVPNSVAAKEPIINESKPALVHGVVVPLRVPAHIRPALVLAALRDAIEATCGLLPQPAPTVAAKAIGPKVVEYEVVAFVESASSRTSVRNEMVDQIFRHLEVRGVSLGAGEIEGEGAAAPALRLLRRVPIFQSLDDTQVQALVGELTFGHFEQGEIIYRVTAECPDDRRALYIIASGVATFLVEHEGADLELRRLSPGDTVGQSGILTGVSVPLKLRAVGKVSVAILRRDALTPILRDHPDVSRAMLDLLVEYQARVGALESEIPATPSEKGIHLLQRLRAGMRRMHNLI